MPYNMPVDETNKRPDTETKYRIHYVEPSTGKKGTDGLFPEKWKDTAFGYVAHLNTAYRGSKIFYVVAVQIPVMDVKTG